MSSSELMLSLLCCFVFFLAYCQAFNRAQKSDFLVQHSLSIHGENEWTTRGRLIIDFTSKSGSLSIHEWTDEEIELWQTLKDTDSGFYRMRIIINAERNIYLQSSVKPCQLMRGEERIILHSDNSGNFFGFDYYTTNPLCVSSSRSRKSKKRSSSLIPKSLQKSIEISISTGDKGDSPYAPSYEVAPPKVEQKSFWSKYWWMILIGGFVLLNSLASAAK